jgi:hypothetical protein
VANPPADKEHWPLREGSPPRGQRGRRRPASAVGTVPAAQQTMLRPLTISRRTWHQVGATPNNGPRACEHNWLAP